MTSKRPARSTSLVRHIQWLLAAVLTLALGIGLAVHLWATRALLQDELTLGNANRAQALAWALSQQRGDPPCIDLLLTVQADSGAYRLLRLRTADGRVAFERSAEAPSTHAPPWFVALLPIELMAASAAVSDGWRAVGTLELMAPPAFAHDALWRSAQTMAAAMGLVGVGAVVFAAFVVGSLRRPLQAIAAQAEAVIDGRFERVELPAIAELRPVVAAMNASVQRLQQWFELQLAQVEQLRAQADHDALTGVAHRVAFVGQLATLVSREDGVAGGCVLLVRLADLAGLNRIHGRDTVDRALRVIAQILHVYPERVRDCLLGRLNGADFALYLPTQGLAAETAESLAAALRSALAPFGHGVHVHIGAIEFVRGPTVSQLLARADLALARAETRGAFAFDVASDGMPAFGGERDWQARLSSAITQRRGELGGFAVVDARRQLVHVESPLRLQLQASGSYEVAAHWLPLAQRCRLTADADLLALTLALDAIEGDGHPRAVHVAAASLVDGGFTTRARQLLEERPRRARALWIEVAEGAAHDHFDRLQRFARALRPLGARIGLEHAGVQLHRIERLYELGVDFVKLDAALCAGVAASPAAREAVRATAALLHALSVQVHAEGVVEDGDAAQLFECGVDAIGGPWAERQAH